MSGQCANIRVMCVPYGVVRVHIRVVSSHWGNMCSHQGVEFTLGQCVQTREMCVHYGAVRVHTWVVLSYWGSVFTLW